MSAKTTGPQAERIERMWGTRVPCVKASSLASAVQMAHHAAQPGDAVLFSPGTSSFDMFKNYEDRGDQFRALVQSLPEK